MASLQSVDHEWNNRWAQFWRPSPDTYLFRYRTSTWYALPAARVPDKVRAVLGG